MTATTARGEREVLPAHEEGRHGPIRWWRFGCLLLVVGVCVMRFFGSFQIKHQYFKKKQKFENNLY
jgi:hypothetical protein